MCIKVGDFNLGSVQQSLHVKNILQWFLLNILKVFML